MTAAACLGSTRDVPVSDLTAQPQPTKRLAAFVVVGNGRVPPCSYFGGYVDEVASIFAFCVAIRVAFDGVVDGHARMVLVN